MYKNISKIANEIVSPFFGPTKDELIQRALYNNDYYKALELGYELTEEQKLEAVKQNGWAIEFINNPSEQVQLEAVKQDGSAILYIHNPSEQVQLEAVKQNEFAIQHIKNPSEQVQLEAIKQNGWTIKFIKTPSEQVQLEAVKQNRRAIEFIKNPCQAVKDYLKIAKVANEILSPFFAPTKQDIIDRITADWKKNQDGSYDVNGDIYLDKSFVENGKLKFKFNYINGDFNCYSIGLTSLEGCPKNVKGDFNCSDNKLTNLEESPKFVGISFYCYLNQLTSLKGAPKNIFGYFDCRENTKKITKEEVRSVCNVKGEIFC